MISSTQTLLEDEPLHTAATPRVSLDPIPRPEYPQPQFQRQDWINLNGTWEFEFDDEDLGTYEQWGSSNPEFSNTILVPFCFESMHSGVGDPSFHPIIWYRRTFDVPTNWDGRRVILHFGAVDYRAQVYVNGHLAGEHEGGHTPFRFDITRLLQDRDNVLVLRVEDPPDDLHMPRGKQHWEMDSAGIFYRRTSGIWQTVWLEAVGQSYLERVKIETSLDGTVSFDAQICSPIEGLTFVVRLLDSAATTASETPVESGGRRCRTCFKIDDPIHWSPDIPFLYNVALELYAGDRLIDQVQSYFGIRTVEVENGRILLNGKPIFLKTILDQGYWPDTNLTAPSDEAIRFDIEMTKEMGFNGVRKHQKIEDPRFLYWADRLGLLVSAEMANAHRFDERTVERLTCEWIEAVTRDWNHPSIVIWVPINESWGVPDLSDSRQQAHLKAMYHLTKSLDASRLVIDNDGWEHTDSTDLFAVHDYTKTGARLIERFANVHTEGIPLPLVDKSFLAPGHKYNGAPVFLSEFGGVAYVPNDRADRVPTNSWGYDGVEYTAADALARMEDLYLAIRQIPAIAGICYTQLCDVEQEINGLMTYDRRLKFPLAKLQKINSLLS